MVDEVGWGIGWGSEGDDITPADSDEEYEAFSPQVVPSPSVSRSRSRHPDPQSPPVWQQEEPRSRSSMEAASRRSTSRMKRSISRAPVLTSQRNVRPSRASSPSFAALNNAILTPGTPSHNSSFHESALIVSPPSLERGRRLKKDYSRSPSPTSPVTPVDSTFDERDRSCSRGRKKYGHNLRSIRTDPLYFNDATELDVVDETADWAAPHTAHCKRSTSTSMSGPILSGLSDTLNKKEFWGRENRSLSRPALHHEQRSDVYFERKRPRSSPPAPRTFWPLSAHNSGRMFAAAAPPRTQKFNGEGFMASPITSNAATVLDGVTRSRSLEFEREPPHPRL